MDKYTYLEKALKTDIYQDLQWVITLLSYTVYDTDIKPEDYSIKYEGDKAFYYTQAEGWQPIEGDYHARGIFIYNEPLELKPGLLENAPQGIPSTTVGRIIMNKIFCCHPFGDKIPYFNRSFGVGDIEKLVVGPLTDTPPEGAQRKKDIIYADEWVKFSNTVIWGSQLSHICVPGVTEKSLIPPPKVKEIREQAIKQYGKEINDPVIAARITKDMIEADKEYLKGDRSLGFLGKKDLNIVRVKMNGMYGMVDSFDGTGPTCIITPLSEGIDYTRVDEYNNASRLGSFARGYETQLGGVAVKELLRASANCAISEDDCGTKYGMPVLLDDNNLKTYMGFTVISGNTQEKLTKENMAKYAGKEVEVRSPAFCKTEGTKYCAKCAGPYLSLHEHGLSSAVAAMGSVFLMTFMKAMHGKELKTNKLDIQKLLS